ncbi:hypothetical protein [uncultured Sphingomonas sp.]|uniref:hypothetical protein n=1 Tax=uncultured Sphingomonas sp. TaxID=158754 RepID=UPI0025DB23B9|nr:hypothetical protein [uncultured Sphingomonas sp.]
MAQPKHDAVATRDFTHGPVAYSAKQFIPALPQFEDWKGVGLVREPTKAEADAHKKAQSSASDKA